MRRPFAAISLVVAVAAIMTSAAGSSAVAADIMDEWANVKSPPAPALKPVTVDARTTALLMLDFMNQNCGSAPAAWR